MPAAEPRYRNRKSVLPQMYPSYSNWGELRRRLLTVPPRILFYQGFRLRPQTGHSREIPGCRAVKADWESVCPPRGAMGGGQTGNPAQQPIWAQLSSMKRRLTRSPGGETPVGPLRRSGGGKGREGKQLRARRAVEVLGLDEEEAETGWTHRSRS